jgi:uncharacterized protein (UPF0335 family)
MVKSGFAKEHLRSFIERIQRLEEEQAALASDKREVYAEAKATGFDTQVMRKVVAILKLDLSDWQEQQSILDLYLTVFGRGFDGPALREVEARADKLLAANGKLEVVEARA